MFRLFFRHMDDGLDDLCFLVDGVIKCLLHILVVIGCGNHGFHIKSSAADRGDDCRIAVPVTEAGLDRYLAIDLEEVDRDLFGLCADLHDLAASCDDLHRLLRP